MDRMSNYRHEIIPVLHRDIADERETDEKKLLTHIMTNVKCLTWPDQGSPIEGQGSTGQSDRVRRKTEKSLERKKETFQKELLLRMPPRRKRPTHPIYYTTQSQVELISYESQMSSSLEVTSPSAVPNGGFSSMYPDPHSAVLNHDVGSATNSAGTTGPSRMYPVLT